MSDVVRQLIGTFRHAVACTVVGMVVVGFADWVYRAARLAESGPEPGSMAMAGLELTTLHVCLAAVFALPVAIVLGLFFRQKEEDDPEPLERASRLLLGAPGRNYVTLVVLGVLGIGVWIAFDWLRIAAGADSNVLGVAGAVIAAVLAVAVVHLVHRIVARFRPRWAAPQGILLAATVACGYLIVARWGTFAIPHRLWIACPPICLFAGWTVHRFAFGGGVERLQTGLSRVSVGLVVVAGVGLVTLDSDGAGHAEAMHRTVLGYPAYDLLTGLVDLDGDGYAAAFDGPDCDDWDPEVRPSAFEIAGNGRDDNCRGGDDESPVEHPDSLPELSWPGEERPNVVFVTVDTLRTDYIGKEVNGASITPTLDTFAREAFVFENAYAPSTHTDESVPAAMAGTYPANWHQHGVYYGINRTVPEVLGTFGYETIGVLCFPWMHAEVVYGMDFVDNTLGHRVSRDDKLVTGFKTTQLTLQYLDSRADSSRPLFLWTHYFDPHGPNFRFPWLDERLGRDAYVHEVHVTDQAIGKLFAGLKERGLYEDSIIVVFSDHGEARGAHGIRTHVWGAYESIVRVPWMMKLPGVEPGSSDGVVSLVDLHPTLADHLGIEGLGPTDGVSVAPLVGNEELGRGPIFFETNHEGRPLLRAVRRGDWKLIYDWQRHTYELYDVVSDPDETINRASARPEVRAELEKKLWGWWDDAYSRSLLEAKRARWEERGVRFPRVMKGREAVETQERLAPAGD